MRNNKWWLVLGLAVAAATSACGGGGGGGNDSVPPQDDNNGAPTAKVAGPLDALQTPLSENVLGQLANAVAGTPLEAVVASADQIVVQDLIDILDVLAVGLRNASSSGDPSKMGAVAGDVQKQLFKLTQDLRELLAVLGAGVGGGTGSDPLAGTPLAPLSAALLPVLDPIIGQLKPGGGNGGGTDLQLTQLAALVTQINQQLKAGLTQIPADARNAPVLGGLFVTLTTGLTDLSSLMQAAGAYNGTLTATRLETTVDHLLVNLLTQVVPLAFVEAQSGKPGVLTGQIKAGVAQLSAILGDNAGQVTVPVLEGLLRDALSPVLDPIENAVLPVVLTPIIDALEGGSSASGGPGFGGSGLGGVVTQLGNAIQGVLGQIVGGGAQPTCLFKDTPLHFLCSVLGS